MTLDQIAQIAQIVGVVIVAITLILPDDSNQIGCCAASF